jgi:hypothetical protein
MAFPKITFLDKVHGTGVPKEQNLITPDNINEIKHVVNSLSETLDNLSGIISGLGSGGVQEIYYINDIEFPVSGINGGLYINNIGQTKYYINDSYIDLSLPVLTDFNTTEHVNNKTVATTLAISSFVDSKIQDFITADDIPKYKAGNNIEITDDNVINATISGSIGYKAGDMIEITDDNTINVVLPKNNLEISGRYLVCHRDIS